MDITFTYSLNRFTQLNIYPVHAKLSVHHTFKIIHSSIFRETLKNYSMNYFTPPNCSEFLAKLKRNCVLNGGTKKNSHFYHFLQKSMGNTCGTGGILMKLSVGGFFGQKN